jgi:glycosyltransferase involved in cell wall biosynthesis
MLAATRVISNSETLKRQVVTRFGVPAGRVDVVHWGIDEAPPPPPPTPVFPEGTPVVLFLGRMTWQKGPDWFLEMAGRVAAMVPEARFVMAGSGDMLPQLIRRSAELGIAHRVHFTGGLGGPDVERVLRMASVCVMPSVNEPFGLVALESLRAGTPCLMPRTAGVSEVVRHALKTDFWDVEDMTDKVVAILRHPVLRGTLSRNGREELTLPRFGLDEPARRTLDVYLRAVRDSEGIR